MSIGLSPLRYVQLSQSRLPSLSKPILHIGKRTVNSSLLGILPTGTPWLKPVMTRVSPSHLASSPHQQLPLPATEGAAVPGCLKIKVRLCTQPSWRTYWTCSFNLKPNSTFGELLYAMTSHHMEPFKFRKIGTAYSGCCDGIYIVFYKILPHS